MPRLANRPTEVRAVVEAFDAAGKSLGMFTQTPAGWDNYVKADDTTSVQTPLTGFAITVANGTRNLILTPAGTLAAGAVTFPASTSLVDGQELLIASTQIITALTLTGNGSTISNAVTTLAAAGDRVRYKYVLSTATWYRIG